MQKRKQNMTTNPTSKLEKEFERWYDTRPSPRPPAAFESWLAGYNAALNAALKEIKNGKAI